MQAYETFVSTYKNRQKKRLLIAAAVMVGGFLLAATGIGIIAAIVAMGWLAMEGTRTMTLRTHTKNALKALHKAGQYKPALECMEQVTTCQIDDLTYAWNEEYLYLPHGAIYPMQNVAWIYPYCHTVSYLFIIRMQINACKLFLTDGSQTLLFYGKAKDEEAFKRLLAGLKATKPELLLGYSQQNQQLYDQLKGAKA